MLKADLHTHTIASYDSCSTIAQIIKRCQKVGINCLAVTDHNEIDGALRMQDQAPFRVIIGEEIFSSEGEVIGLFLKKRIKPGRTLKETVCLIKEQGGVVYLPHPVSGIRKSKLSKTALVEVIDLIDLIELHNARTRSEDKQDRMWVERIVSDYQKTVAVASDAHSVCELGNVIVSMDEFSTQEEFLTSVAKATFAFKPCPLWIRIVMHNRIRKLIRKWQLNGRQNSRNRR
mgnify:CR=1 FL=1